MEITRKTKKPKCVNKKRWNGKLVRSNPGDFYHLVGIHREKGFECAFRVCNCAPEMFDVEINGRKVFVEDPSEYASLLLSENGPQRLIDRLKRRYRRELRLGRNVAYGFRRMDVPKTVVWIDIYGKTDDLQSRLAAYKETKAFFQEKDWQVTISQTASLGAGHKVEHVKEDMLQLNPKGACTLQVISGSKLLGG